ncbi:hypothetical protein QJ133_28260 [Priestia megaterium]|uniref:hypothetical protein n=1 Tax=Priestia megaterium TaxID=1404 RepID=UPI00249AD846|nr:hypothetical protein [Priestia megaterium]MDI3095022.1 hypothetical protein [Priestia megaterium]
MDTQINEILNFYIKTFEKDVSDEDLTEFLKKEYGNNGDPEFLSLLINNFIMVQSEIMRDLKEINETIMKIDLQRKEIDPTSYEFRKLDYCKRINIQAKEEIEIFLTEEVITYVKERVIEKKKWKRVTGDLGQLFDVLPYNYSHFKRYYNPNYDFSTDTKYRFLRYHNPKKIQPIIDLKSNNISEYYADLEYTIESEQLLNQVITGIKNHHVLEKRNEIFETLESLYTAQKYQTFINLAVIQVEGLFYDFCLILNDEIEFDSPGTLSVKAEKAFSSNRALWLSMYPYFAFEAPIFRNKIAHNGLWDSDNLKDFANELIFDLYAIIKAIKLSNKLPYNLLGVVLPLREDINTLEYFHEDYGNVILSLLKGTQGKNAGTEFFNMLKRKDEKRKELEFYHIQVSNSQVTNLYEECKRLTKAIHDERFWDEIIRMLSTITEYKKGRPFNFVDFVNVLVKNYIAEFPKESALKQKCIEINKNIATLSKG